MEMYEGERRGDATTARLMPNSLKCVKTAETKWIYGKDLTYRRVTSSENLLLELLDQRPHARIDGSCVG
jgi:hypothetical protein